MLPAYRALRLTILLFPALLSVRAERLPVKLYTTTDGLARNRVQRIMADSRGLIWVSTSEGLSQFDGYRFLNYGTRDGLPSRVVNDVLETREGTYWVATDDGLCVLHPHDVRRPFTQFPSPNTPFHHAVNQFVQDRSGVIWAAADVGLLRVATPGARSGSQAERIDLGGASNGEYPEMRAVVEDRQGSLWIGGATGLYRRYPDGTVEAYSTGNGLPTIFVETLLQDSEGRLWAGTREGLCLIVVDPHPGRKIVERVYTEADGLGFRDIKALALAPDGTIWAGCLIGGLTQLRLGADGRAQFRTYGKAQGLNDETIIALTHDREGNLWVGGESGGLMRIVRSGFLTYSRADGLTDDRTEQLFEDHDGELCVVANDRTGRRAYIDRFTGHGFQAFSYPHGYEWPWVPVLQDHTGQWWLAWRNLVRISRSPLTQLYAASSQEITDRRDFSEPSLVYRLFEDSTGAIWISYTGRRNGVGRWREGKGLELLPPTNGPVEQLVTAFAEDSAGDIWLGLYGSGVVRYRAGVFRAFGPPDGFPNGYVYRLFVDAAGRLWIGSADGGLGRVDQPAADHPSIRTYDTSNGLSSDTVSSLADDQWGRIYIGTGRGLDRLDPPTERIKHYTTADGLANDQPTFSLRDRHGWLWFSTTKGLSRLVPGPDELRPPPAIRITALFVAGAPYTISQLGETYLEGLQFATGDVRIEFASVNFEAGEVLRYQYRIQAKGAWSAPADLRSVNLAGLSPGAYRFEARAVDSRGQVSEHPAAIAFEIPPPVWGRVWFRLLVLSLACLVLYGLYRIRLGRVVELEHIRTRIATDLHDDIGSSLSQIAILSEVARRPSDAAADALDPLGRIAAISRELVDSMADIVWAVNPKRDNLLDLTRRMRQFAGEMLVAVGIEFTFETRGATGGVALGADLRRQVFLVFKECVNNAVRHSGGTQVDIFLAFGGGSLRLTVRDNGRGFDPAQAAAGHGLASMAARAQSLGGSLHVASAPGAGTKASLEIPLAKRRVW